jgi:hypothetical protein
VLIAEINSYQDPLDLLHRFAPTPLRMSFSLDFATVQLETNDLGFFPSDSLQSQSHHGQPLHNASPNANSSHPQHCLWKIVRDVDIPHTLSEATIVMAGSLIVYSMGPACTIGADRERKEILAFIGREVDARIFQESILPALCRLTEFVLLQENSTSQGARAAAVSVGDPCDA